jgi:flagellin-like protein
MVKMKGITPVIAIILLLLITISITGFAFVWFSRITTDTGTAMQNQTRELMSATQQRVNIEAISATSCTITVRNTGGATIPGNKINLYVNNLLQSNCIWNPTTIVANGVASCTWIPTGCSCTAGTSVKVTTPGGTDMSTC